MIFYRKVDWKMFYISVTEDLTTILNSHLVDNKDVNNIVETIIEKRKKKNYKVTRSRESYVREVKTHNRMYKMHLFRKHTKDCDLEENIVWWKDIFYWVIGW